MTVLFVLEIAVTLLSYLLSRNKHHKEIQLPDDTDDWLKPLLPIGLELMSLLGHKYGSKYERKLEAKIRDLKGGTNAHAFLKLHIARKTVVMMGALLFATFVGTQIEVDISYVAFCPVLLCTLFYVTDRQLDIRIKQRLRSIRMEFPEFLNKLVLLVNAGLTVTGAIQKIVDDNVKNSPLYTELAAVNNEIQAGESELRAYENFAKRCKLQEVIMFVTILMQNLRKGNDELIPILRLQTGICWENRKNAARKLGEEASARLLLPMMIMFVAILIMVVTPAILQIKIL